MPKHFLLLLTFYVLMTANVAHAAFEVRAEVKSDGVRWDNVTRYKGNMLPSMWEAPVMLQAAESWTAATFSSTPPNSMVLQGDDTSQAVIPVNITGVQYNTTGIEFAISNNKQGGGCSLDEVNLPLITVQGKNCISSSRLINAHKSSPFVFFRPIFDVDENSIVSALRGKPEGTYSAFVPINIRYYYENDGLLTYRNLNEKLIFLFDYRPVQLDDVYVDGDGVMTPIYDTVAKNITSTTSFNITATGYFNDGLILTLPQKSYELINSNNGSSTIPYDIRCSQCAIGDLVKKGKLLSETTPIGSGGGVQTMINFSLDFSYDVMGERVTSGDYVDEVTIVLEPSI
ncbi:conserved exported hypothetical protein [Vibrio chagasii]|uniref:hypothetical protein n=1 Tax=Vibrio chagasii TaxID=170679 RepID=UPI001EFD77BB|nr:hypothetical protein [Vibrio chagasii]MCG9561349.1 hypothetical protein [Vibrio chagasii]MCG9673670.1 hypothetical protein [Vibrio chagasii]CAH6939221.1 conserved exported hypothetical protein [Vibrio chagasii]CAH6953942.1 conserved exported hypothetical protein [Vibrio chagasii]CAH6990146.1 conserved exported hypothetical protein [Vibrio chagasii]